MKRYLHILLCALPAVLIASCDAREETAGPVPGGEQEKLFCASSELASKAYVEGLKVLWDASDALAVYDDAGSAKADFALKSGAGTGTATFSGRVSSAATKFFAAYPGSSASAVSEGILTLSVPAEQKLV